MINPLAVSFLTDTHQSGMEITEIIFYELYGGHFKVNHRRLQSLDHHNETLETKNTVMRNLIRISKYAVQHRKISKTINYLIDCVQLETIAYSVDSSVTDSMTKQEHLETVKQYKYPGTWITEDVKCISEVKRRIAKAKDDFWKCKEFLRANLNITLKKRLLNTYVFSIIGYGSEAWTFNKEIENKIISFEYWCYRRILKISLLDKVSNKTVLQLMGAEENIS
ncbi:hypothetical protein GQR58_026040 [Nymphon striatum]|nr:hypothetical protein GQR58_026040 [Nymphon striatum]